MIPAIVEAHLRAEHSGYEHHVHAHAETAWGLAGVEHAAGERVAKSVVLSINGELSIAVVAATDRVDIDLLERVTGSRVTLVAEDDFAARFQPCAPGAEPPLAIFGTPIYVDEELLRLQRLVMAAGTYEEVVVLSSPDREALLVDWLNELILRAEVSHVLFGEFQVDRASDRELVARVFGWRVARLWNPVKAATFHEIAVRESTGGYEAIVILDV